MINQFLLCKALPRICLHISVYFRNHSLAPAFWLLLKAIYVTNNNAETLGIITLCLNISVISVYRVQIFSYTVTSNNSNIVPLLTSGQYYLASMVVVCASLLCSVLVNTSWKRANRKGGVPTILRKVGQQ